MDGRFMLAAAAACLPGCGRSASWQSRRRHGYATGQAPGEEWRLQLVRVLFALFALLFWIVSTVQARDLAGAVAAVPNPRVEYGGWVADPAGAIRARQADINGLIAAFEAETGVEIAVVVLPSIGDFVPKAFATELFNHWGVGKKGKDNGILVLQVLDQRSIEIETGYGMEGVLPDVKCHWIVEDVAIPFFRAGSFSDGHYEIVRALIYGIGNPDAGRQQFGENVTLVPGAQVDPAPAEYELPHGRATLWNFDADHPLALAALIALPTGLIILVAWSLRYWLFRRRHPDPRERHDYYQRNSGSIYVGASLVAAAPALWELQSLGTGWAFLALLPGWFLTERQRTRHLKRLRDQPRLDPKTGEPMRRLSEREDDAYLEAGNVSEEKLGSVKYDVWVSPSGYVRIERYGGPVLADRCVACGYETRWLTGSRTLHAATSTEGGLAEDIYRCAHCGRTETVKRVVPPVSSSSSSSDGSFGGGGSSGGGSFGGGSSGGGGSGGRY